MSDLITRILMLVGILALDLFIFYHIKQMLRGSSRSSIFWVTSLFWVISTAVLVMFWRVDSVFLNVESYRTRGVLVGFIGLNLVVKIVAFVYLLLDKSISWGTKWWQDRVAKETTVNEEGRKMSRTLFLKKAAVFAASVPLAAKGFSIINRAYDYRIHRVSLNLKNLPRAFDGITLGQISDIHTGSFYNKVAVQGGVDLLLQEKPDMVLFTGDLVNVESDEVKDYYDIFKKIKAPQGVYSILGNHDYGDYRKWPSSQAKAQNFQNMLQAHQELGWDLLRNEHRIFTEGGDKLALLGVENWGVKRFSKHGDIDKARAGTDDAAVKILLSHDPSHWEAKVLQHSDIDLTLSGHTHGFQFGVEIGNFTWSPAQYLYRQWAGHYQQANQHIYVNRGYGFVGMPGRIGINPEITIIQLKKA